MSRQIPLFGQHVKADLYKNGESLNTIGKTITASWNPDVDLVEDDVLGADRTFYDEVNVGATITLEFENSDGAYNELLQTIIARAKSRNPSDVIDVTLRQEFAEETWLIRFKDLKAENPSQNIGGRREKVTNSMTLKSDSIAFKKA
jgi:ABC-type glycerol-3-phosphate transport system substrate-binding protein